MLDSNEIDIMEEQPPEPNQKTQIFTCKVERLLTHTVIKPLKKFMGDEKSKNGLKIPVTHFGENIQIFYFPTTK